MIRRQCKIHSFLVKGVRFELDLVLTYAMDTNRLPNAIDGLKYPISQTVERLVIGFEQYTLVNTHVPQTKEGLEAYLCKDTQRNFPIVSSHCKISFTLSYTNDNTGYIIEMHISDKDATYSVPGDRELRDPGDPFPLIFADCFQKLWKRANAIGLTTSSMDIEQVCSVIEALAFGESQLTAKDSVEKKDPNSNLEAGCVSGIPVPRTKPVQITVDRYTLGDAVRRSYLLRGKDSWCSVGDDVINHFFPE